MIMRIRLAAAAVLVLSAGLLQFMPASGEYDGSPANAGARGALNACAEIWAQKSTDALDAKMQQIRTSLALYRSKAGRKLDDDMKALAELNAQLNGADNTAIDSLARKVQQMPAVDPSALIGSSGDDAKNFIEKHMIASDFKDSRDVESKVIAKRREVHEGFALMAAFDAAEIAIRACAVDQRNYLKGSDSGSTGGGETGPPSPSGTGTGSGATGGEDAGPRFANGQDPTTLDRTSLAGSAAGTYTFVNCVGEGTQWQKTNAFLLRIAPNYAISGFFMFGGQRVPLNGALNHDNSFRVTGTQPSSGAAPYQFFLNGHADTSGSTVVIMDGTILAGYGAENVCNGTLSK